MFINYSLDSVRFVSSEFCIFSQFWSIALIEDSAMVICLCTNLSCWRQCHGHLFVYKPFLLKTVPWSSVCVQTFPAEDSAMVICLCPNLSCWRQCHGHLSVSKPFLLKTVPWSPVCVQTFPAEDSAMVICLCPNLSCWRQCHGHLSVSKPFLLKTLLCPDHISNHIHEESNVSQSIADFFQSCHHVLLSLQQEDHFPGFHTLPLFFQGTDQQETVTRQIQTGRMQQLQHWWSRKLTVMVTVVEVVVVVVTVAEAALTLWLLELPWRLL